ncbi:MAG: zinc ribbon domain-containing protein [Rhodococcus sp. (in: high G+C Gram-positive bacteria)]
MAEVPAHVECVHCGDSAPRTIASPALGRGNSPAMRAHDAARATAEAPHVVSSIPGKSRRGTPTTSNPLHRKLPRP